MPLNYPHPEESTSVPQKPSQRRTIALPFAEPVDEAYMPYILSDIRDGPQTQPNALWLTGVDEFLLSATPNATSFPATIPGDVATLTSGVDYMSLSSPTTTSIRLDTRSSPTPRTPLHKRGARSASGLSPITLASGSAKYWGKKGNSLLEQLLGSVTPPLSPTHGTPIAAVNFG